MTPMPARSHVALRDTYPDVAYDLGSYKQSDDYLGDLEEETETNQ